MADFLPCGSVALGPFSEILKYDLLLLLLLRYGAGEKKNHLME